MVSWFIEFMPCGYKASYGLSTEKKDL